MTDRHVGIVSYGAYIPRRRIAVEETLRIWNNTLLSIMKEQLLVSERVVLSPDEDTITMAVEAGRQALDRWGQPYQNIGGLFLGTCTNPYDSRPASTVLVEALGDNRRIHCADIQFSTKSGSSALHIARAMVLSGAANNIMALGSDTMNRHTAPGTFQEYVASSAAAAFILGSEPDQIIAEVGPFNTVVSDLSDSFRLDGERYIRSGGLSTLESGVGLFKHVSQAVTEYFKEYGYTAKDFDFVVFQQPVGVVPVALCFRLGFSMDQVIPGLIAYEIGDIGSASALVSLALTLDQARPGQKILLASHGFGTGADVTMLTVTENISQFKKTSPTVEEQLKRKDLVDYATAMKYEGKYMKVGHALTAWL
jgi:2-acetylphloroglucinol acetyltransferase